MSFFSSEPFLGVVAHAYHRGRDHAVVPVRVGDAVYRLLVIGRRVITDLPFLDYVEPEPPGTRAERAHPWMPRAVRGIIRAASWSEESAKGFQPSPFIDWREHASWEAFVSTVQARSPYPFRVPARKRRRIERELGAVRFVADSAEQELLSLCMRWKSQQYRRTELIDLFARPAPRELFFELQRRGLLSLATLYAGARPVAIHAGVVWNGRFYYWLPAHDPELGSYSPGTVLLEELMRASYAQDREFDFLLGDESYKWSYASHSRLVGEAGTPTLSLRLARAANAAGAATLKRQPQLYAMARALKRRLREAALLP